MSTMLCLACGNTPCACAPAACPRCGADEHCDCGSAPVRHGCGWRGTVATFDALPAGGGALIGDGIETRVCPTCRSSMTLETVLHGEYDAALDAMKSHAVVVAELLEVGQAEIAQRHVVSYAAAREAVSKSLRRWRAARDRMLARLDASARREVLS